MHVCMYNCIYIQISVQSPFLSYEAKSGRFTKVILRPKQLHIRFYFYIYIILPLILSTTKGY